MEISPYWSLCTDEPWNENKAVLDGADGSKPEINNIQLLSALHDWNINKEFF